MPAATYEAVVSVLPVHKAAALAADDIACRVPGCSCRFGGNGGCWCCGWDRRDDVVIVEGLRLGGGGKWMRHAVEVCAWYVS